VIEGPPGGSYWRVSEDTLWELDSEGRIWWGEDKNNVPRIKRFLSEVQEGLIPQTVWDYDDVGHTQEAKQEYLQVLHDREVFTTPKPVALLKRIFQVATGPGDVIMDSFAGSGTAAQAVIELNQEDGGCRRFVLVQMPFDNKENEKAGVNICSFITAERVKRVIGGYSFKKRGPKGKSKQVTVKGTGGSFTYARLGPPLFNEYRNLPDRLPSYEEIAKYIFYTETSRQFNPAGMCQSTGKIGEHNGTSYYLLYTPNGEEDRDLNLPWLRSLETTDGNRNLVVYCEKVWVHRDDLSKYEKEAGRAVRPMLVPFHLK